MDNTINNDIIEKATIKRVAIYKAIGMLPPITTKDLWEEKNSIEPKMNCENKNVSEINDTMKDTKMSSMPKDWKGITNKWVRSCPKCNIAIIYSCKSTYNVGIKRNSKCYNCSANFTINKKGWNSSKTRSCPQCNVSLTYSSVGDCTNAEKKNKVCRNCCNEKRKQSILDNLNGKHTWANYNPKSLEYFDKLNIENDWSLQHALNGGEVKILNYFVDAYDKERNIVVEYDESYHYDKQGNLKQKDVLRQQRIITHLGCKFFRYNEKTKELYEIKQS